MAVPIDDLLRVNFSGRPVTEQIKIVAAGKPRPPLKIPYTGSDGILKNFNFSHYDKEMWLTGCDKRSAFFCWTCIMFVEDYLCRRWNISGFNDFLKFDKAIYAHKHTLHHLIGMLQYHIFLKNHRLSTPVPSNNIPNTPAKSNSGVLKRIIDVVCLMVPQAPPPCQRTNQCTTDDCIKLLNLTKPYDDDDVVDEAISLVRNSPDVVKDIVTTLANFVREEVQRETKSSTFVSVVISQHRDVTGKCKLSTIVRYVANGSVSERFVGFRHADSYAAEFPYVAKAHVDAIKSEFELSKDKFLSLSTDGAVPSAQHVHQFLPWLRERYPRVLHVPSHFHEFSSVLRQVLSQFPECTLFFKYLESLKSLFECNPGLCSAFHSFVGGNKKKKNNNIPNLRDLKLTDSQFLRVLKMYRRKFIQFFDFLRKETKKWTQDDIVKAISFQRTLKEYPTVFLLETFFQLFERVAFLSEVLSSGHPDGVFDSEVVDSVIQELLRDKEDGFEKLWTLTATIPIDDKSNTPKTPDERETQKLYQLYLKIIDCTIQSIQMRFYSVNNLKFIGIFDFENSRNEIVLSNYHLQSLAECQSTVPFAEAPLAVDEMKLLMRYSYVLKGKSAIDLLDFLWRGNLHKTLKNLYKLVEFIVTLPCKPASPTNSSAKFDSMKSWSSFPEQFDCLGLLSIENDLLQYLKSKIKFYDEVISKLNCS